MTPDDSRSGRWQGSSFATLRPIQAEETMPRQRNRSTRHSEQTRVRAGRRGPTPKAKRVGTQPSRVRVVVLRLVRVTAVILAVVGFSVLLIDWIEDWPERESFDLP